MTTVVSRRVKTGSLLLFAIGVAGAAAIHRATHGVWFGPRVAVGPAPAAGWFAGSVPAWPAPAEARRDAWTAWNPIPVGLIIRGVRGERPDDVWAWSDWGIMHWDGRRWTRVRRPLRGYGTIAAVGESEGVLWVRLERLHLGRSRGCILEADRIETHDWCRKDGEWRLDGCGARRGGGASSWLGPITTDTFVGRDELARLWSAHPHTASLPPIALERGYRVGGGELWAVDGDGRWLAHFDGARWTAATNQSIRAIWLAGDDDGWRIDDGGLRRWDGGDWKAAVRPPERLTSIWGAAADDVWAVGGDGLVMHFDGQRWRQQQLAGAAALGGVTGRARDDVWVSGFIGGDGFTAHWDGSRWTPRNISPDDKPYDPPNNNCPLLAAQEGDCALAVLGSRMFERRGGAWEETVNPMALVGDAPGAAGWISGIAADGARPGGAWVVGRQSNGESSRIGEEHDGIQTPTFSPFVVRREGVAWTKQAIFGEVGGANRIWARAADDVWVVGSNGMILHFDGRTWTREESGTDEELVDIHGAGRTIWVVGNEGGLLRRRL
jgi:hypothetical protein